MIRKCEDLLLPKTSTVNFGAVLAMHKSNLSLIFYQSAEKAVYKVFRGEINEEN